jgi:phosphopantothenoylcysteine decarboxylase/phosphopantothenate--cysteine ligase
MGYAIAQAALEQGCTVDLVSGPVSLTEPDGAILYPVVTGDEMLAQVDALFGPCDILIKTAAVCDFRPKDYSDKKVKKSDVSLTVEFEPVVDILKTMAQQKKSTQTVVGFAAETTDVEGYARRKLQEKNLDLIVANQVGRGGGPNAFESDSNKVILLGKDGLRQEFGPAPKLEIARLLMQAILDWHQAHATKIQG